MRKVLIMSLGLIGLAVSARPAMAETATCSTAYSVCFDAASGTTRIIKRCATNYRQCRNDGSWGDVAGPGTFFPSLEGSSASVPEAEMPSDEVFPVVKIIIIREDPVEAIGAQGAAE